ncbi:MAG: tetratricopeptide repeat protein [Nitrospiraceae bacterium]|jgi:predicted negative regulator of RcsB-dependent stress response|nr:MAG: tetratricopeptide repeat protein [Nitrospiraceae bacterium]
MPRPIKTKIKKKKVETEVEVKGRLSDIVESLQARQKSVMTYGIIFVFVMLAVVALFVYNYRTARQAHEIEYKAYKLYHNEFQDETLPREEQLQQALDLFQKAYQKKSSPRILLYMADTLYELGRNEDALVKLNDLIKKYSSEEHIVSLAYQKMTTIHLAQGSTDEALKTLDALYGMNSPFFKDYALIESARILEKQGKIDEAQTKYKTLAELFFDSPYAQEAQGKLKAATEDEGEEDTETDTEAKTETQAEAEETKGEQ